MDVPLMSCSQPPCSPATNSIHLARRPDLVKRPFVHLWGQRLAGLVAVHESSQTRWLLLRLSGRNGAGWAAWQDRQSTLASSVPAQHVADVHDEAARERVHPSPRRTIRANLQAVPGNRARSWECLRELPPCEPTACHAACMLRNILNSGALSKGAPAAPARRLWPAGSACLQT